MNKRADIPIIILVIGVIAICILAIFSFINASNHIHSKMIGPGLIETVKSIKEQNTFGNKNIGLNIPEVIEITSSNKVIIGKYSNEGEILIEVEYNF